ncbi:MAG: Ig-like domain-containing protein [Flavobacteriales bacterium]|nr:Ig-like domain-containing protein [Flavobacteriales bacterium]
MRNHYLYLFIGVMVLSWSCANIIPLEGGPKDTSPPKVLKVVPDTFKTRFTGNKISLFFDEFVTVKNANKEVFVSPPMKQKPELILRGKLVDVIFRDSLLANTTYIIQFGKAIADNNEGNVMDGYSYVFSTGDALDSLTLKFEVLDAFTLKPMSDVKILLYNSSGDSLPYNQSPFYMGITQNNGQAVLKYLRTGDFKIFALLETNDNLLYDKEDEQIGFLENRVISGDSIKHRILLFKEKAKINKLRYARMIYPGKIAFKFAHPADSVRIEPITDSLPPFARSAEYTSSQHDSLIYWYQPLGADTIRFRLMVNGIWDTISVRPVKSTSGGGGKGKGTTQPTIGSDDKNLEIKSFITTTHDFFQPFKIELNHPLKQADTSKIEVWEEKQRIRYFLQFSDTVPRVLSIHANWKQGKKYTVRLFKGALTDILNLVNDSTEFNFTTTQSSDYVSLTLNIQKVRNTTRVILQWLKEDDSIIREETVLIDNDGNGVTTFNRLAVGKYRIRMIYDINNNGQWDTGAYLRKIQPEKVSYFPQVIEVRKGFDMSLNWDVTLEPVGLEGGKKSK